MSQGHGVSEDVIPIFHDTRIRLLVVLRHPVSLEHFQDWDSVNCCVSVSALGHWIQEGTRLQDFHWICGRE